MALLIATLTVIGALVASQPPEAFIQMARVSGQVIEEGTNTPVAGARVFVVLDRNLSAPAGPPLESMTDQDGRYHIDTLSAGRSSIGAQKDGFAPSLEPSTKQMFEVAAGQAVDGLTVTLRRGGVINGRVLDSPGQPLTAADVLALLKRLNSDDRTAGSDDRPARPTSSGAPLLIPFGQSRTNDLGEFQISGLPPGEYLIAANPNREFGGTATSSPATSSPGMSTMTIRLVTVAAFQVSGIVVDDAGFPMADVMVRLEDGRSERDPLLSLSMGPDRTSQSDASGRFTLSNVAPGSYTLRADRDYVGAFATFADFFFDSNGTPRAGSSRSTPARAAGTIEVTVENANVTDLRIIVPRSQ
jgi:protocatechuate 3,4-dioxygenase beta subunit